MIGTAQGVQGRSRASRGWLAALALGVALAFGAGSAFAGDALVADQSIAKKKDGLSDKAATAVNDKAKKDSGFDKDTLSQSKGFEGLKTPEIKTGDEHKKP
jgi:hypothetical protein